MKKQNEIKMSKQTKFYFKNQANEIIESREFTSLSFAEKWAKKHNEEWRNLHEMKKCTYEHLYDTVISRIENTKTKTSLFIL